MADAYIHQHGNTLVIAPTETGRLAFLAERRRLVLNRASGEVEDALARWIFADLPRNTLQDAWGNAYDHQALHLVAGTLADGKRFARELEDAGFALSYEPNLFVPLETIDAASEADSDNIRTVHARAFALAIRRSPRVADLILEARDRGVFGD